MECQFRVQCADFLAVTERSHNDRTIHIAELRRFQERQTGNAFTCGQFKSVCNQSVVLIAANLDFIGV